MVTFSHKFRTLLFRDPQWPLFQTNLEHHFVTPVVTFQTNLERYPVILLNVRILDKFLKFGTLSNSCQYFLALRPFSGIGK